MLGAIISYMSIILLGYTAVGISGQDLRYSMALGNIAPVIRNTMTLLACRFNFSVTQ
jgi:hypothetical protein